MSEATHGGKGDRYRSVDRKKYDANFDAIFGKDKKKLSTENLNPESKSSKKSDSN